MMLSLRYAIHDMRGSLRSLRIAFLCLVLGVGAIAAVQFVSQSISDGIKSNGQTILGGDMVIRSIYAPPGAPLRDWFTSRGAQTIETIETRVMLANVQSDDNALVELKAVPSGYPFYGRFESDAGTNLPDILNDKGILLDPALRDKLGVEKGDSVRLGTEEFTVRGFIQKEPDRAGGSRFGLAPRAIVSVSDLGATGLLQAGSMVYYDLRIKLPANANLKNTVDDLKAAFLDAPWKVTDSNNASPQISRFLGRLTLFLTLVGLSTLLIGGIGVNNGIRAHFESRLKTIAIFKMLGAGRGLINKMYLWQIGFVALSGTITGVAIGASAPYLLAPALSSLLPFELEPRLSLAGLALPAAFGILTSFAFALLPLGQAIGTSPLELFRNAMSAVPGKASWRFRAAVFCLFLTTIALAIANAQDKTFAIWFVAGSILCLTLFWTAGQLTAKVVGRFQVAGHPGLRLGLRNLSRPGNATSNTLISLGLGLTVMMSVTLIDFNLRGSISESLPKDAPAFFFLDIQGDQKEGFEKLLSEQESAHTIKLSPNLRGRIVEVNGVPAREALVDNSESWLLQNDRGFTYAAELPAHSDITSGEWWPSGYKGPPLVSVVDDVERGFGVKPGDTITVNILGRDITATIANVRSVNWMNMTINFAITFAPGTLEAAPQTWLATVVADPARESEIQRNIGRSFPNISMIRLSEAIDAVEQILSSMATAVRVVAMLAIITGMLVLAGSLSATKAQRLYDTIILKVLGIGRRTLLNGFLFEFTLLGLVAGFLSLLFGTLVSWAVLVPLMDLEWRFYAIPAVSVAFLGAGLTIAIGWFTTNGILSAPVAAKLRPEY